jgi:hypothetical protein
MVDNKNSKRTLCSSFQISTKYITILSFMWQIINIGKETIVVLYVLALNNLVY